MAFFGKEFVPEIVGIVHRFEELGED